MADVKVNAEPINFNDYKTVFDKYDRDKQSVEGSRRFIIEMGQNATLPQKKFLNSRSNKLKQEEAGVDINKYYFLKNAIIKRYERKKYEVEKQLENNEITHEYAEYLNSLYDGELQKVLKDLANKTYVNLSKKYQVALQNIRNKEEAKKSAGR